MTTSDLERRLTALLQQHAEDAMNTTNTEERLQRLLEETEQNTRRSRRRWAGGALVAAAAAGAIVVWASGVGDDTGTTPQVTTATADEAEDLATAFLDAYGSWDRGRAASYVTDPANVDALDRGWMRWSEAVGFTLLVDSCQEAGSSASVTRVQCPFDYHALGSDELGLGPFSDSVFALSIRDGEIVTADEELEFMSNGFSEQMWEPFAAWVSRAYPEDAAVMYADWPETSLEAHSGRSIELWRQHTQEYVEEQTSSNDPSQ
jgi:hypothetical protein